MAVEAGHHAALHADPPPAAGVRLLLDGGDGGARARRDHHHRVLVVVHEQLLEVPGDRALIHLNIQTFEFVYPGNHPSTHLCAVSDPVRSFVVGTIPPARPLLVDQRLLGEERVDAVTHHHQLAVPRVAVQLQLPDDDVESVRGEGEPLAAHVYDLHQRGAGHRLLADAEHVVAVGDQLGRGQQPQVGLLEVLEEDVAVHDVVHLAGVECGRGNLVVSRQPLLDLEE